MARTLTLELPDKVFDSLCTSAAEVGTTPEALAAEHLIHIHPDRDVDPLLALAGTLECELTDVAERHDHYIGQSILIHMRNSEDA